MLYVGNQNSDEEGVLANVDYGDDLTRYRFREVYLLAKRSLLPNLEKLDKYVLVDSFYVHYRNPILKGGVERDLKKALWKMVIANYINSEQYREVSSLTRLNGRLSRIMAVKLARIYVSLLNRIERNERLMNIMKDSMSSSRSSRESREVMNREIRSLISFYMGNMRRINETISKARSILGPSVGHEVAELILGTDIDPYRVRLVNMLNSLLRLIDESSRVYDMTMADEVADKGLITGIKHMSKISEIKDLTPTSMVLAKYAKPIYAYKLSTGSLTVRERRLVKKHKIYLVIDKSGSMFYTVVNNIFELGNVSKITWAAALAITMILKGHKVVARFFDQQVYQLMTDKRDIVKVLLSLVPLGGTNITAAVRAAQEDALRMPTLKGYKLILITDGEDDELDLDQVKKGLETFSDYKVLLIGSERSALEQLGSKVVRVTSLNTRTLVNILKRI